MGEFTECATLKACVCVFFLLCFFSSACPTSPRVFDKFNNSREVIWKKLGTRIGRLS